MGEPVPKGIKSYDKDWLIGDTIWRVRFLERMSQSADGWCVYDKQELLIDKKIDNEQKFLAFVHEVQHAMDHVYEIGLTHPQIHKLEAAWANFLLDNVYGILKILI